MRLSYVRTVVVCTCVCVFGVIAIPARVSAQSIPSPWVASNIGSPSPAGAATYSSSRFTISAGGSDIGGTADHFFFVNQQLSGDVELVTRVDSLTAADPGSKVGVMVRADLTSGAAY